MSHEIMHDRGAHLLLSIEPDIEYEEARGRLNRASMTISADANLSPSNQAALLTLVSCAALMFRGGVFIDESINGRGDILPNCRISLRKALIASGARTRSPLATAIHIHVGHESRGKDPALYVWTDGWLSCVAPSPPRRAQLLEGNILSGVLAGALAVSEAFRRQVLNEIVACQRNLKLSAWGDLEAIPPDATLKRLPREVWLIGLGNLGQALLFTLGLLPWDDPSEVMMLLNDGDFCGRENLGVQILTQPAWIGMKKARAAAAWAEARGFNTIIDERRFIAGTRPGDADPRLALVGVDNLPTRRSAAGAGFSLCIDGGLGATGAEAFDLRVHVFPGSVGPERAWPDISVEDVKLKSRGLRQLVEEGRIDICGAMTIAGQPVGVPCTALAAAAIQIAQTCRALETGRCAELVDVILSDIRFSKWQEMQEDVQRLPTAIDANC